MECVAGFWSNRLEEGEPTPWSSPSFHSTDEKQKTEGNEEKKCSKISPGASLSPNFTRGSYRRYMNHLIRSNFSEKLHVNFPTKSSTNKDKLLNVCSENIDRAAGAGSYLNSNFHKRNLLEKLEPETVVPSGDCKNYIVRNRNVNSRDSRFKSLASLSRLKCSGMRGAVLPTTNGVETDGGVAVDNKGDAPSSAPRHSFKHPSTPRKDLIVQCHAEVVETLTPRGKHNIREISKGRQRKTGANAITPTGSEKERSCSTGTEQEVVYSTAAATKTSNATTVLRFPCVEKLIHKYTLIIAEQKERAQAEKHRRAGIQTRVKQDMSTHRFSKNPAVKRRHELENKSEFSQSLEQITTGVNKNDNQSTQEPCELAITQTQHKESFRKSTGCLSELMQKFDQRDSARHRSVLDENEVQEDISSLTSDSEFPSTSLSNLETANRISPSATNDSELGECTNVKSVKFCDNIAQPQTCDILVKEQTRQLPNRCEEDAAATAKGNRGCVSECRISVDNAVITRETKHTPRRWYRSICFGRNARRRSS